MYSEGFGARGIKFFGAGYLYQSRVELYLRDNTKSTSEGAEASTDSIIPLTSCAITEIKVFHYEVTGIQGPMFRVWPVFIPPV